MRQFDMTLYLRGLKSRYLKGNRAIKKLILDELCHAKNCHRKHAIRLLTRTPIGHREHPAGRKRSYDPKALGEPLKQLWLATDQMCGARLKAAIPLWLPYLEMSSPFAENIKLKLLTMSERTINRLLKPYRAKYPKRLGGTKPGTLLKKHIAIKTEQWNGMKCAQVLWKETQSHIVEPVCWVILFGVLHLQIFVQVGRKIGLSGIKVLKVF